MPDALVHPAVVATVGWLVGWWLWGRPRRLHPVAGSPPDRRRVLVVVPARNEEQVLGGLLQDLTDDPGAPWRIVVVDDHSTDGTATLARSFPGVEVISSPPLPQGWTGKSWACHVGVSTLDPDQIQVGQIQVDTLLFLDADVRLAPGAADAAVANVHANGGLVSVQPFHVTDRLDEQLSLFPEIVSMMGTGAGGRRTPSGAFGPLIATSLAHYRQIGGHAEVRHEIAEDVALGLRYRDASLPVAIRLGGPLVRFRMYPVGLGQLIEGWTKNMATGAGEVPTHRTLGAVGWITAAGTAFMALPLVPGNTEVSGLLGAALYLAFVVQTWVLGRALGTFGALTALVYPLPLVGFMALFLRSLWRSHVRRSVTWRGRSIHLGSAGPVP